MSFSLIFDVFLRSQPLRNPSWATVSIHALLRRCEGPRHCTTLVKGYIGGLDDRGAAYIREAAATVVTVISVVH